MKRYQLTTLVAAFAVTVGVFTGTKAQEVAPAAFTSQNEALLPDGYRQWVFIGAPLTPNALNNGKAPFPEFHNVYVETSAFAHYQETGTWAEGTQIVKELVTVRQNDNDEVCATQEVSGRGYQQGKFAGLELAVKDSVRFPGMPGGWAYFSFGHHAPPYAPQAAAFPVDACNACHEASADTDFVFTQFYPVLRVRDQ